MIRGPGRELDRKAAEPFPLMCHAHLVLGYGGASSDTNIKVARLGALSGLLLLLGIG